MAGVDSGLIYSVDHLQGWTQKILHKVGVSKEDAVVLTDSMIEASLRGVDTHGITGMLCVYVKRIQKRVMRSKSKIVVVRESDSSALLDCHNSIGQIGASRAMQIAIEKAAKTGVALSIVTHSNHYGMAAYWAMMALPHGMIGISSSNTMAAIAPTGGRKAMLGTNPFAIAIPADRELPVVLDLATTVVARGRIALHAKQNKPLEPGWALDDCGVPTTDPHLALKGLLVPIGGYKGYGLALVVDILCGLLSGSNYGAHFPGFIAENMIEPNNVGSIFVAVNISNFMALHNFKTSMDKAIQEIKNSDRAPGVERIYLPGEIEFETKTQRLSHGIPIPNSVVSDFINLGKSLGVPF